MTNFTHNEVKSPVPGPSLEAFFSVCVELWELFCSVVWLHDRVSYIMRFNAEIIRSCELVYIILSSHALLINSFRWKQLARTQEVYILLSITPIPFLRLFNVKQESTGTLNTANLILLLSFIKTNTQVNWIIDNHNPHVVDKCLMIVPLIWNDEGVKTF